MPFDASSVPRLTRALLHASRYRLRVFVLLISLDWLASGDFGPFAGSVSARKPCGKCYWTGTCDCSFLASNDPRRDSITHAPHCEGVKPRTHEVRS